MLVLNKQKIAERKSSFTRKQKYIDATVLRYCDPYIPKISGTLIQSGIRATKIGSGLVVYNTPYAKKVYYSKKPVGRSNGSLRGNSWFQRMKNDKKDIILKEASKIE